MKLIHNLFYLICFLLLFSLIAIGCSSKGEKTAAQENLEVEKGNTSEAEDTSDDIDIIGEADIYGEVETTDETDTIDETAISVGADTTDEVDSKDGSPWKLVSESSVETAVTYAGFVNETFGVTVGYEGATSYTEDGGKSWTKSSNVSACRYGLDLYYDSFIVDCGNSGVNLVSTDKGKTWSEIKRFPPDGSSATNKFLSVIDTSNIYIGDMYKLGVSSDGGASWKELAVPENCSKIVGMFFMTTEIGYLLCDDGTLYKTKDACDTWTTSTIDLMGEKFIDSMMPSVTMSFQDEDHGIIVYATKSYKLCCIKTEDGGSTWKQITVPKGTCFTPYLSRDGKYLTLCSMMKKVLLYHLEEE